MDKQRRIKTLQILGMFLLAAMIAGVLWWTIPEGPTVPISNTVPLAAHFNRLATLLDCPVRAEKGKLVNPSISQLLDCLEEQKTQREK